MALVLIIDDDAGMRRMASKAIEKAGHQAICAQNGREGVEVFAARRPAVVITDILMPEKEGVETIRDIYAAAPETCIIAMSGGGARHDMSFLKFSEKLGAGAVMTKPFRPADLVATVERLLKKAEDARGARQPNPWLTDERLPHGAPRALAVDESPHPESHAKRRPRD